MALTLPKLALPKLAVPKLALTKKQAPAIVGGVIVLAAAGWFGWQYFAEEPPPPSKPQAVTAAKAPAKAVAPADTPQARDKQIEEALTATGMNQQLNQLPRRLIAGIAQSGTQQPKASAAMVKSMEDAVAASFTADGFRRQVGADLSKNFDQKRLQALVKDFSTPAGKAMIELERASPSADALAKFAQSEAATKPSPQRTGLIKRIDAATRASDLAVETAFISMKALALGIAGKGAQNASVDKAIEKQRDATTQRIRDTTWLNLAFSFKDASDADLEKYAAIYDAENSKWFYGQVYASVLEEVRRASSAAGERLGESAKQPATRETRAGAGARPGADARACLARTTNTAIIKCAEQYR